jgi:putative oxidoreductase
MNLGLVVLRVGLGLTIAAHGSQKLFGWYGGSRIAGFSAHLDRMGLIPATFWAWIAALSEFVGGLLVALGLLSPLGCFAVMGALSMAIWLVHWPKGFVNGKGGIEFPLLIWVGALALSITGPGDISLDSLLGLHLPEPATWIVGAIGLVLGVGAGLGSRGLRADSPGHLPAA